MIRLDPLRDVQQEAPADYCQGCGAELYGEERGFCLDCSEKHLNEVGEYLAIEAFNKKDKYAYALGCLFGLINSWRIPEDKIEVMKSFLRKWEDLSNEHL